VGPRARVREVALSVQEGTGLVPSDQGGDHSKLIGIQLLRSAMPTFHRDRLTH
jgi:hypothetical protein